MRKIIDTILSILIIISCIFIYYYRYEIIKLASRYYNTFNIHETTNAYVKDNGYITFKQTNDFTPENKEELINVLYTILNDGMDTFAFNCDYQCEDDIHNITNDGTLSLINNYVHPYNSYNYFNIKVNEYGTVYIDIEKNYTEAEIKAINEKIHAIAMNIINRNMTDYEKIKAFHDYVISNTVYDEKEAKLIENNITDNLTSHKAYNVLIKGVGVCGGYTDSLAIFLNQLGIKNFKISTNKHIWNVLYIDGTWKHIDMTWDDPVSKPQVDRLIHDYFMISSNEIKTLDSDKHNFDISLYKELN